MTKVPEIARLHGVEEERAIVADGRDIERIAALIGRGVGAVQQFGELVGNPLIGQIDGVHVGFGEGVRARG